MTFTWKWMSRGQSAGCWQGCLTRAAATAAAAAAAAATGVTTATTTTRADAAALLSHARLYYALPTHWPLPVKAHAAVFDARSRAAYTCLHARSRAGFASLTTLSPCIQIFHTRPPRHPHPAPVRGLSRHLPHPALQNTNPTHCGVAAVILAAPLLHSPLCSIPTPTCNMCVSPFHSHGRDFTWLGCCSSSKAGSRGKGGGGAVRRHPSRDFAGKFSERSKKKRVHQQNPSVNAEGSECVR